MKIFGLKFTWYKDESFMWNVVQFIINNDLCDHKGKFEEGDVVRYNWKAMVQIGSLFRKGGFYDGRHKRNLLITGSEYKSKSNYNYIEYGTNERGSTDAFWLRHAYWWEL